MPEGFNQQQQQMNEIKSIIDGIEDKEVLRALMRERQEARKRMRRGERETVEDLKQMISRITAD